METNKDLMKSISNFAFALESLVDELKKQGEEKEEKKTILGDIFGENGVTKTMKRIEDGINKIKTDTSEIISNQKKLLSLNKQSKKGENGVFDGGGDKKTMAKIKDGVGSIILIAGAVLAIGMAFKIIGHVDVISVLTLSFAITLLGHTLSKLQESGMPKPKESLMIGLSLLSFVGGAVASSWLLSMISPISGWQLLTFAGILGVFALMSFGINILVKSTKKIKAKQVLFLPLIMVGISLSVMLSSHILKSIQPIAPAILLNILFISLTVGVMALAMALPVYIIGKMGGSIIKGAILSILTLPAMSLALMLSSHILSMGNYSFDLPIKWVLSFSLAMLLLAIPVVILGATGPAAFIGALALVAIAGAITLSSHILAGVNTKGMEKVADSIGYFIKVVGASIADFASKILPILVSAAEMFMKKVLPPIKAFIEGIVPVLRDFLKTIIKEMFPYFDRIMTYLENSVKSIKGILEGIGTMIDRAANIFPKIGKMFTLIGEGISKPIEAIGNVIEKVSGGIVSIITSVTDGIKMMSELDPKKLTNIGNSLSIVGEGIEALTGGLGDTILQLISGGKSDPITRILKGISEYGKDVPNVSKSLSELPSIFKNLKKEMNGIDDMNFEGLSNIGKGMGDLSSMNSIIPIGKSLTGLSESIKTLNNIDIEDSKMNKVLNVLERINQLKSSGSIETINRQVLDGTDLVQKIQNISEPSQEEMLRELKMMNRQLFQISSSSVSISSQLNMIRNENSEDPKLSHN